MAVNGYDDDDFINDAEVDETYEDDDETSNRAVAGVSAWGLSIVIHAVIIALMAFIVFYAHMKDDQAPLRVRSIDPPPEVVEEKERDLLEVQTDIESEVIVEEAVVTELELPVEELETEDEVIAEVPVKGREEADAVSEMGGPGAFMAIGAGGGASGAFGNRNGGGRKRAVGRYGGTKASESAVEAALRWFMRHQSPNGQWDVDAYPVNCKEAGPKCEPGSEYTNMSGDIACSGYALLCFLGAGYDHRTPNRYQQTVKAGIEWLLSVQQDNGLWGVRNYEHPVATMALAEAYAMTNDPRLRTAVEAGVGIIMERQTADPNDSSYKLGWDYIAGNPKRMDSSVTGWNVMALKSAKVGGIDIGASLEGAERWLEQTWKATNPDWASLDPYGESKFPYTWSPLGPPDGFKAGVADKRASGNIVRPGPLTNVGLLCSVFLGKKQGDIMLDTMANYCFNNQTPEAWPTDTYYMYYNTLGMFQYGGDKWTTWNGKVRDMLVGAQRKDPDCFDGSWDPQGAGAHKVSTVGRLLVTAYCTLSLEVYYRYMVLDGQRQ